MESFLTEQINRRDALKRLLSGAGMLTYGSVLFNCATMSLTPIKESTPVHYPKQIGHKIQSPEHYGLEGCFIGMFSGYQTSSMPEYANWTNKLPSLHVYSSFYELLQFDKLFEATLIEYNKRNQANLSNIDEKMNLKCFPVTTLDLEFEVKKYGLKGIVDGNMDDDLKLKAKRSRNWGIEKGGFFVRSLREMNIKYAWPPWRGNPKNFIKAYKHIWDVFDGEGANEYATWLLSPYSSAVKFADSWERYYPGDKYVDWVGFNGYNFGSQFDHPNNSFFSLFCKDYNHMRVNHPTKPIMVITGTDEEPDKSDWVSKTFFNVKNDFPGIKGLCWWSDYWSHNDISNFDSRIDSSAASLKAFIEGVSDPYFLAPVLLETVNE